jgi:hypothetical protein
MLYCAAEQRMVNSDDEQKAAESAGFSRTPPPPYEEEFPRWYCERPASMGGHERCDLRRVQINNSEQERQFFAVVDSEQWMGDAANSLWGARGVTLADLVQERRQQLKDSVDRELLEIVGG